MYIYIHICAQSTHVIHRMWSERDEQDRVVKWQKSLFRVRRCQRAGWVFMLWKGAVRDHQLRLRGREGFAHCTTLAAHCVTNLVRMR